MLTCGALGVDDDEVEAVGASGPGAAGARRPLVGAEHEHDVVAVGVERGRQEAPGRGRGRHRQHQHLGDRERRGEEADAAAHAPSPALPKRTSWGPSGVGTNTSVAAWSAPPRSVTTTPAVSHSVSAS